MTKHETARSATHGFTVNYSIHTEYAFYRVRTMD